MRFLLVHHPRFLKSADGLSRKQQEKLAFLIERLCVDPYDPLLHTKHLSEPLVGTLSFRISRDWRATFQFLDNRTIQLMRVKHRKDIYR